MQHTMASCTQALDAHLSVQRMPVRWPSTLPSRRMPLSLQPGRGGGVPRSAGSWSGWRLIEFGACLSMTVSFVHGIKQ